MILKPIQKERFRAGSEIEKPNKKLYRHSNKKGKLQKIKIGENN
jgi:hypothetical protein